MSRREVLTGQCDCAEEGALPARVSPGLGTINPPHWARVILWFALFSVASLVGGTVGSALFVSDCEAQKPTHIRPDTSAAIILASNYSDETFDLSLVHDSSVYPLGQSRPHSNSIWVIRSTDLGQDALLIVIWKHVGTDQMVADSLPRHPGVVNIYKRQFGDPPRKAEA